eukprot:jgi/Mesen1/2676/ME000167S01825
MPGGVPLPGAASEGLPPSAGGMMGSGGARLGPGPGLGSGSGSGPGPASNGAKHPHPPPPQLHPQQQHRSSYHGHPSAAASYAYSQSPTHVLQYRMNGVHVSPPNIAYDSSPPTGSSLPLTYEYSRDVVHHHQQQQQQQQHGGFSPT